MGITSQLSTVGFAAAVAAGVAMSVLAIRFGHKTLLMTGILLQVISATFLAPTFGWLWFLTQLSHLRPNLASGAKAYPQKKGESCVRLHQAKKY